VSLKVGVGGGRMVVHVALSDVRAPLEGEAMPCRQAQLVVRVMRPRVAL